MRIGLNMAIAGDIYVSPNVSESSIVLPVNAVEVKLTTVLSTVLVGARAAYASVEWATLNSDIFGAPFLTLINNGIIGFQKWINLGTTRNIRVGGETGTGSVTFSIAGFGIIR